MKTEKEEGHVRMEAEIGVTLLQTEACPGHQKPDKAGKDLPQYASTSISRLQYYVTISNCCCKPSSLWYFVTAALGKKSKYKTFLYESGF